MLQVWGRIARIGLRAGRESRMLALLLVIPVSVSLVWLMVSAGVGPDPGPSAAEAGLPSEDSAEAIARLTRVAVEPWQDMPTTLKSRIDAFAADQATAGLAVAVQSPAGRYLSVSGDTDVTTGTAWSAADRSGYRSITKCFVGTVILQLAAEGKLALDGPVTRYVPKAPDPAVTVRMALAMRTGLPDYSATPDFSKELNRDYERAWTDQELLTDAFSRPLDFDPGSRYQYSNTNTVLLGQVIQAVTAQTWDKQVTSRILAPLKLN